MSPVRGFRNDTDFTRCHMLEPAQVIYSSHELIAVARMMAKPPHQDCNAGRNHPSPHQSSDNCDDDVSSRPIFTVGVGLGQLVHRRARADGGFLCRCGCIYAHINDLRLCEVWDARLLYCYFITADSREAVLN